ncbi:MAG: PIN domain-containing protein [Arcobacter sp.]|nr:PIN domain-containing protein [Arcobacter sp.]
MKIVINDANIIIDLVKLNLLDNFSKLNFELYTTDFVFEELNEEQKSPVSVLHRNNKLTIIETTELADYQKISDLLERSNGLSFEDCSVWYYATKLSGTLLTGDRKLRKQVSNDGIEVRGIIYIFDELIKQKLLDFPKAIEKIKQLTQLNSRLPQKEIAKRIALWKSEK